MAIGEMINWLAVALGGALGAVGRYAVMRLSNDAFGFGFPYGTLIANVMGSLLMGILIEAFALRLSPSAEMRAFLIVGVLGAFTTFSTFSLDTVTLFQRGETLLAALYVLASVGLSIGALLLGLRIARLMIGG